MLDVVLFLIRDALLFLGHLAGQGNFPKPLSRAQEAQMLDAMRAGDDNARHTLIEHNLRLVAHVVKRYTVPGYTQEDLVSVGTLGLVKAVNTFKPGHSASLSTYAARCIENEVLMLLRAGKKRRNDISLNEPLGTDGEGNDITFADILGSPQGLVEDEAVRKITLQAVREQVKRLPVRERTVLEMRYGLPDGVPRAQHEVARALGISRSYVSRVEKRALSMIQKGLTESV